MKIAATLLPAENTVFEQPDVEHRIFVAPLDEDEDDGEDDPRRPA